MQGSADTERTAIMPAKQPEECDLLIAEYINAGDVEGAVGLYEATATLVTGPGKAVTGFGAQHRGGAAAG